MVNELTLGTRRVGDFIDFDPDTPEVKVSLEHSDRGISITIPWSSDDNPYASWFLRDSGINRISPRLEGPTVPKKVLFHDSYGSVLLVGCYARGFHSNMFGPGSGTLWARAAIMGVSEEADFENPHGLQTDVSGLRSWLGISSWKRIIEYEPQERRISIESINQPDIEVGEYNGVRLTLKFGYEVRHENDGDRQVLSNFARCVTRSSTPKSWAAHLKLHRAIRDLLVLSRWHEESCYEVSALRLDDPLRTSDEKPHGEQWRGVVIPGSETQTAPKGHRPHLFEYNELRSGGLLRWIALRDEFARALDPVISSIGLKSSTANTLLAHTGPGLEALGYLLMLRDGVPKKEAKEAPLKKRFERILEDLGDLLPLDGQAWVDSTCATYNGLKHANRKEPDLIDVLNTWRECVLITRAWVANELGVPHERLKERLSNDPQRHVYVKVR